MTITLTLPMVIFAISLLLGWTGFLLGAIKWLLTRQITALESKIEASDKKASTAIVNVTEHEKAVTTSIANLRLEFSQKMTCANHSRMETNDKDLFVRLDNLHGDIREMCGGVKALTNSLDLINQHLLNGGK